MFSYSLVIWELWDVNELIPWVQPKGEVYFTSIKFWTTIYSESLQYYIMALRLILCMNTLVWANEIVLQLG